MLQHVFDEPLMSKSISLISALQEAEFIFN